ncbi:MAG TPA: SRPBCC family protein [Bradyrhizobium sp.]|nr:SRPBCC family protein [Bradyrhizobium sp.]
MSKPEFVYVIYIHAAPEKIWQALIDPEMTRDFWGRHRNTSDWKPGSAWQHQNYDDASDISVAGTVVESYPPRRLVLTWGSRNSIDVSRVTFDIEEFMGSTKLTVTHRELSDEAMRGISAGWPAVLSSLKTLLETGASLPMTRQYWGKAG